VVPWMGGATEVSHSRPRQLATGRMRPEGPPRLAGQVAAEQAYSAPSPVPAVAVAVLPA
jgi:hypothetical protein